MMRIREASEISRSTRLEQQQSVVEAIEELDRQHAEGVIETPAYLIKKRSLVRML